MGVKRYLMKRGLSALITLLLIVAVNFLIFRIMPGDPTRAVIGDARVKPETRAILIKKFGLDQPIWVQFGLYISNLAKGDLGISFQYAGTPVAELILGRRLVNTVVLMGSSISLAFLIGLALGVLAAWRRGSKTDSSLITLSLVSYSIPTFWLGLFMLLMLGFYLGLIPLGGTITEGAAFKSFTEYAADYLHHMTGPLLTLTISFLGYHFMIVRNSLLNVLTEDYIVTARAKGVSNRVLLFRHALKNAFLPQVSILALEAIYLFSGATATETVFSWHGLGLLLYEAVKHADLPVLQGLFLFIALTVITANFIADIAYCLVDPRVKYG